MQDSLQFAFKPLQTSELGSALELVWRVFSAFEAPEYSELGIKEFKDFIEPDKLLPKVQSGELTFWGCYNGDTIIGVISMRGLDHICLLFVDPDYHRRGIASHLFQLAKDYCGTQNKELDSITVNSSPFAAKIYEKLGFQETDAEQTVNGIRFVPMIYKIS